MDLNNKRLYAYYINIYNEYIFFSDNIETLLKETDINFLTSYEYLSNLFIKLKSLKEEQYYPKKVMDNIEKLLQYIFINNENELLNKEILNIFNEIKNIPSTDNVYLYHYNDKFGNIKNMNLLMNIDSIKDIIEYSIMFDMKVFRDIISKEQEIELNPYYVFSVRKFLIDFPEMFFDKNINSSTIYILNQIKKLDDKVLNINISDESNRLLNNITKIKKFNSNLFDYKKFVSLYEYIFMQNLMVNKNKIVEYEDLIDKDLLNEIYDFIDNGLIYNNACKNNILEVMSLIRPCLNKNELFKYNEYIGKLNSMDTYNEIMIYSEIGVRFDLIKTFQIYIDQSILNEYLENDLEMLNLYTCSLDEFIEGRKKLDYNKVYLSIKKFIEMCPSMFDDETIYERTMELLKKEKKLKKIINKITLRR